MPIQPIDMQTLFMRLSQIGKEQAVQKEAAHLAQTLHGSELVRESEQQAHSVNLTRELEDGPDAIKEEEQRGGEQREAEEKERRASDDEDDADVFRDPDLGTNIDITG